MMLIPRPFPPVARAVPALVLAGLLAACADGANGDSASNFTSALSSPSSSVAAPTPAAAEEPKDWLYLHGTLNVRAKPDEDASVVRTLRHGDMVQLGPKDAKGWARVYTGAVGEEYVYRASDLVRTTSPEPQILAATATSATTSSSEGGRRRSSAASRGYHLGPRGGCYTYTRSGNKRYVDRSYCR